MSNCGDGDTNCNYCCDAGCDQCKGVKISELGQTTVVSNSNLIPIVTGSGYEIFTEEGDTVIVFLERLPDDQYPFASVIRVDPADSLGSILLLLNPED